MFNLIPDGVKEKIWNDYQKRHIIVWLSALLVFVMVLLVFLLPTYVYVLFEEENMRADVEAVKNSLELRKADDVVGKIKETNEQLKALSWLKNSVKTAEGLEQALHAKDSFIHVTEIQYFETKIGSSTLMLKGIADKRESLRGFVTKLQSIEGFSKVELPVSNFAKDKDIEFTINMILL